MSWRESRPVQLLGGFRNALFVVFSGLTGVLIGVAVFTFGYANGWAYFGNDPATCNSCHAMNKQYNAWLKGSHHTVAGCNDCHAPHGNLIAKYANKAENGFSHSMKFTLQNYPQNIKIRPHNKQVTQDACLYCHSNFVSNVNSTRSHNQQVSCLQCHSEVGHKR